MGGSRRLLLVVSAGIFVFASQMALGSAETPSAATARIVFGQRFGSGCCLNGQIYVMNPDGTGKRALTGSNLIERNSGSNAADLDPSWSPDGLRIAFMSDRDGNDEIYVMNDNGTGETRITNNSARDREPAWSPDGSRIAFASDRDGNFEVYSMNADGSGASRLTNDSASESAPVYSPDGSKIAFASDRDGNSEIYVMNADGSLPTRLTIDVAADRSPDWSPDGSKIAFASDRDGNSEIYVMNADGTGQTRLTNDPKPDLFPAWAPDGTRIAFSRAIPPSLGCDPCPITIYTMDSDGSDLANLGGEAVDLQPDWEPSLGATCSTGGLGGPTLLNSDSREDGPLSEPVHATVEPLIDLEPSLSAATHEVNCDVVITAGL